MKDSRSCTPIICRAGFEAMIKSITANGPTPEPPGKFYQGFWFEV